MVDIINLNKFLKIIPVLKKLNLSDLGVIFIIFFFLCKYNYIDLLSGFASTNNVFFYFGSVFIVLGTTRTSSSIDLTYNMNDKSIANESGFLSRILHVHELKMGSKSQFSLEIVLDNKQWKENLIKHLVKKINFYLILEYHPNQINILLKDFVFSIEKASIKLLINDHISKENFICPMEVILKNYEDKKKLSIYLKLDSTSKIYSVIASFLSRTLFSQKKELLIRN